MSVAVEKGKTAPPPLPDIRLPSIGELPKVMHGATWITWFAEWKKTEDGTWKLNKPPSVNGTHPTGGDSPKNLTTFAGAIERAKRLRESVNPHVGVGVSFWKPADFWILDLDNEPYDSERVQWILENAPTWAEISVSGHGLHFVYAGAWNINTEVQWRGGKAEIIGAGKYVAITGNQLPGTPSTAEVA